MSPVQEILKAAIKPHQPGLLFVVLNVSVEAVSKVIELLRGSDLSTNAVTVFSKHGSVITSYRIAFQVLK